MQWCATAFTTHIVTTSGARHVHPLILASAIYTHISHASGSVSSQVPRLPIEPRPVDWTPHTLSTPPCSHERLLSRKCVRDMTRCVFSRFCPVVRTLRTRREGHCPRPFSPASRRTPSLCRDSSRFVSTEAPRAHSLSTDFVHVARDDAVLRRAEIVTNAAAFRQPSAGGVGFAAARDAMNCTHTPCLCPQHTHQPHL